MEGAKPFKSKPFRLSPVETQYLKKLMNKYKERNWIRESESEWASPTFLVPKKSFDSDGNPEFRLVIDYRKINKLSKRKQYPLPNMESILDSIKGSNYFSSLDFESGYHQVPLTAGATQKAAFVTPFGLFAPLVLPFGLHSAPAEFMKFMNENFAQQLNEGWLSVYLDDLLVHSATLEKHLDYLTNLFLHIRKIGARLRLDKCNFCLTKLKHLGHIISNEG